MGALKFGRNYTLSVQLQNGDILTIEPPFTIEFDITRNILNSANVCAVRIYNLSQIHRNLIEYNIYNQGEFRSIALKAGYGNDLSLIFNGNIKQAWSVREGTNFITQIECYDAGFAYNNAVVPPTLPFPSTKTNQAVIEDLVTALSPYYVNKGKIGNYEGLTGRGKSYTGSIIDVLWELTGKGFYIDNGFAYCLKTNECFRSDLVLINSESGLLGTPVREQNILTFDVLFEPRVIAGQVIELDSATAAKATEQVPTQAINGLYKITMVKHRGMISGSVCGNAVTTIGMLAGNKLEII